MSQCGRSWWSCVFRPILTKIRRSHRTGHASRYCDSSATPTAKCSCHGYATLVGQYPAGHFPPGHSPRPFRRRLPARSLRFVPACRNRDPGHRLNREPPRRSFLFGGGGVLVIAAQNQPQTGSPQAAIHLKNQTWQTFMTGLKEAIQYSLSSLFVPSSTLFGNTCRFWFQIPLTIGFEGVAHEFSR